MSVRESAQPEEGLVCNGAGGIEGRVVDFGNVDQIEDWVINLAIVQPPVVADHPLV